MMPLQQVMHGDELVLNLELLSDNILAVPAGAAVNIVYLKALYTPFFSTTESK